MENKITLYVFFALLAIVMAVAFWPKSSDLELTSPGAEFALWPNEIPQLTAQADSGDVKAAVKLARYFQFLTDDSESAKKWLRVAAKLGDVTAQYNLGFLLLERGDSAEGLQWMELAARNGDKAAADRLLRIEAVKRAASSTR